jgi:hypothetical protein
LGRPLVGDDRAVIVRGDEGAQQATESPRSELGEFRRLLVAGVAPGEAGGEIRRQRDSAVLAGRRLFGLARHRDK